MSSENNEQPTQTRREFLKTAGTVAASGLLASTLPAPASADISKHWANRAEPKKFSGGALKPTVSMAKGRALGANDRILIGHIGVGGQGGTHVRILGSNRAQNNTQSIGVSDCWQPRIDGNKAAIIERDPAAKVQGERDYRRLLDNKDIDAIVIATPEHWHAQVALDAMQAGKHVYIEKPMCRYLNEAFDVYDMQKRTGKVVQIGSQGCSDTKWHVAGEAVKAGKIGAIVASQGSYTRNSKTGEWNYDISGNLNPDNFDWKMWLGSAPDRPWSTAGAAAGGTQPMRDDAAARFFRYRKYRDYSGGLLGDLLPHKAHPLTWAVFGENPEFPRAVTAIGTRAISTDREVADTIHVTAEYPSGHTMYVLLSTVNEQGIEDLIRGHKGTMRFGGNRVQLNPEGPYAEEMDATSLPVNGPGEDIAVHEADWLNAIRTGKTPNCDIERAVRVQAVISMAEMSELSGRTVKFDPKTRKVS